MEKNLYIWCNSVFISVFRFVKWHRLFVAGGILPHLAAESTLLNSVDRIFGSRALGTVILTWDSHWFFVFRSKVGKLL